MRTVHSASTVPALAKNEVFDLMAGRWQVARYLLPDPTFASPSRHHATLSPV